MEENVYDVIFLDDDGSTVLDMQKVPHGEKAEYKGKKPAKAPTEKETYVFDGWENEEMLECVTEKLVLVAKYTVTVNVATKDAFYEASQQNAEQANLAAVLDSGKKVSEQQRALEKDPRTAEQIVADIVENGKTEIGPEINRDDMDR